MRVPRAGGPRGIHDLRRRPVRAAPRTGILLLTLTATLVMTPGAGRAEASSVVSTFPADGVPLDRSPTAVSVSFDRPPDPGQSHIGIADDAGRQLAQGEVTMDGTRGLRQPMKAATRGTVVAAYHVVFLDGSETFGAFRFSVGTGGVAPASGSQARKAAESSALSHNHTVDPINAVLLLIDFTVAAAAVLLLILRPRRRTSHRQAFNPPGS
jgi:methionine-rich copper-binding protein CopC